MFILKYIHQYLYIFLYIFPGDTPKATQCRSDRKFSPEELHNIVIFHCLRNYSDIIVASKQGDLKIVGSPPPTISFFPKFQRFKGGSNHPPHQVPSTRPHGHRLWGMHDLGQPLIFNDPCSQINPLRLDIWYEVTLRGRFHSNSPRISAESGPPPLKVLHWVWKYNDTWGRPTNVSLLMAPI